MSEDKDKNTKIKMTEKELEKFRTLKQLVLDTETTGLYVDKGDRLVEIAAIEVIGGIPTGKIFHSYINPERESNPEALKVHRLSSEFLKDKPLFSNIAEDFLKFIEGYEIVIHNERFDSGFINTQLNELGLPTMSNVAKEIICTLQLDKDIYTSEKKHSLDAILTRFGLNEGIEEREKEGHGAILDCELLASVYKRMIEEKGWSVIRFDPSMRDFEAPPPKRFSNLKFTVVEVSQKDLSAHEAVLASMLKEEKQVPIFNNINIKEEESEKNIPKRVTFGTR